MYFSCQQNKLCQNLKALGIDYKIISASDIFSEYRQIIKINNAGKIGHIYKTAEEQVAGDVRCEKCKEFPVKGLPQVCDPAQWPHDRDSGNFSEEIDLMMSGSPCTPFSTQRAKRFVHGDIADHRDFATTMQTVLSMYKNNEPKIGLFEQVMGFCRPMSSVEKESPKERRGVVKQ